jgi:predicted DNA binding CopG/RHH family protein
MTKQHRTTVRLPEDLHRRVKAKAALKGRSLSDVFRLLLEKWDREEITLPELEDTAPNDPMK